MGEQLGAGGVPGAPSAHGLPDIAAAKALVWNVELERGLRVTRPGAPIEAILKTGPRMLWWNEEPISSAETAALYKLVDGQDKTFANAMLQRLADSFRTGNNLTRLCIVKAFLLVSKSRASGLFKKERIANHQEVLKRVKTVMDSGDVVARALALRMLGCLGEIAAHSVDVHRLVIEALESPHHKEVDAALFATGCLCELSPNFAQVAFERVVDMANAMGSSPATKLAAIRVFSKFGVSPRLSLEAHEAGESLLLRLPTTEIVSAMLTSLTALALKSTVTSERQVELLFAYVSSDPRATVRAVALQNLSKSARLSARTRVSSKWSFSVLLSVAEDSVAAPALRVLAFQVLHKLSGHFVKVVARTELFRFLLTVESSFLSYPWPLRQTALECLGSFGCNLKPRYEDERILREGMQEEYQTNSNFVARVGLLLCDQLALEGALALGNKVTGEEQGGFDPDRLVVFTGVLARLMQSNPEVAPVILDSLSLQIKTVTKSYVEDVKSEDAAAPMDVDGEEHPELAKNDVVTTRLETELDFVLTLCHCMHSGVCGMDLGSASSALPKLMDLTTEVSQAGYILRATLPTLLRLWSLSGRRASNIEGHITKCIDQMTEIGDSWAAYKVASGAAAYGFWSPACALFDALVKKVHSEGCYLWLSGLSHVAKAEAALKVDPARAIPLLRQVGSILAAGVCSERTFEFQRWLISIRLRMVQSVADLLHILSLVLSDGEILSALRTARERASGISTQLMHLGKEVDLLGLSFLGLDEESLERLREASVSCSLLAFCTEAVFSSSDEDPSIVRDLYLRVKHVESLQALLQCEDVMNGPLMGGCSLNSAVVRVCDWAITVINKLQRGASDPKQQDVRVEALHFLRLLIGECLQLPCSIPRYFFCTRPRAAVELFVAQTGGEELSELCVKQGSSLILSICAQLTNEGNSSKISSLFCVVTFQGVESTSHVEEDLYADWKLGWHEGQAVDHPLVEKLVQRAKCEDVTDAVELEQELVSLPTAKEDTHYSSKKRSSGRSFAVFLMDKKGKGFSSCNLDVSAFLSGQYQLSFDCVGVDTNNKPWLLLPSRIHPSETLKITSTG